MALIKFCELFFLLMAERKQGWIVWVTNILSIRWIWFVAVFVAFVLLLLPSVPKSRTGIGASDEFMIAGKNLSVMTSPGYPAYVWMEHLVMKGESGKENPAYRVGLMSLGFGAIGLSFMFLSLWKLYDLVASKENRKFILISIEFERWWLACTGTLMLGLSGLYWIYCQIAERYSLTCMLMSVMLYLSLVVFAEKNRVKKSWFILLSAMVVGLGISHQWQFITWIPLLGYFSWKMFYRKYLNYVKVIIVGLVFSLAPWLLLIIFARTSGVLSQIINPSFSDVLQYVGVKYLGDGFARAQDLSSLFIQTRLDVMLKLVGIMLQYGVESFGWWISGIILMTIMYYYSRKKLNVFWLVVGMAGIMLFATVFVDHLAENRFHLAVLIPQFLPIYILFIPVLWFGLWELTKRVGEAGSVLGFKQQTNWIVIGLVLVPLMFTAKNRVSQVNLEKMNYTSEVYKDVLSALDNGALMICFQKETCDGLGYEQEVRGVRKDVTIVPSDYLPGKIALSKKSLGFFDYQESPWVIFDLVLENIGQRSVYVMDITDDYYQLLGINLGFINYLPLGYFGQLVRGLPDELPRFEYPVSDAMLSVQTEGWNLPLVTEKARLARRHALNATVYMKAGMREVAYNEANYLANFFHSISATERESLDQVRESVERTTESQYYMPGFEPLPLEEVLSEVNTLWGMKAKAQALEVARGAVITDPKSVKARMLWADLLVQVGASDSAVIEYQNALKLDSNNKELLEKYQAVKQSVLKNDEK